MEGIVGHLFAKTWCLLTGRPRGEAHPHLQVLSRDKTDNSNTPSGGAHPSESTMGECWVPLRDQTEPLGGIDRIGARAGEKSRMKGRECAEEKRGAVPCGWLSGLS